MNKYLYFIIVLLFIGCKSDRNSLVLECDDTLLNNNIDIYLKIPPDYPLTKVYSDNKYLKIPNGYGENDWIVVYGDSLAISFRHFKTNKNSTHNYCFNIDIDSAGLFCNVDISGKNRYSNRIRFICRDSVFRMSDGRMKLIKHKLK